MQTAIAASRPLLLPSASSSTTNRLSDSIAVARVVCILGVVYVHAWTGLDGSQLAALRGTGQETLRWVLMEMLGRSAVPLLGLISGWLVAGSSRTRDWRAHVARKARTIVLPMVLWNLIAISLVFVFAHFGSLKAPTPNTPDWIPQELFIISRNPDVNVQMPFLRDLFLCMVAAPLLVRLPVWGLWIVAAAAAVCFVEGWGPPVLMRASILAFFTLGMIVRRTGFERRAASLSWGTALLPFAVLMPVQLLSTLPAAAMLGQGHDQAIAALDLATRIAAALFFWRLSWGLGGSALAGPIRRIEPFAFLLFCAHLVFIWLAAPAIGVFIGPLGSPGYPAFLLLQPLLVLAGSILLGRLLVLVAPGAAMILSGGRLKPAT